MSFKRTFEKNKKVTVIAGLTVLSFILSLFATAITKRYGKRKK